MDFSRSGEILFKERISHILKQLQEDPLNETLINIYLSEVRRYGVTVTNTVADRFFSQFSNYINNILFLDEMWTIRMEVKNKISKKELWSLHESEIKDLFFETLLRNHKILTPFTAEIISGSIPDIQFKNWVIIAKNCTLLRVDNIISNFQDMLNTLRSDPTGSSLPGYMGIITLYSSLQHNVASMTVWLTMREERDRCNLLRYLLKKKLKPIIKAYRDTLTIGENHE